MLVLTRKPGEKIVIPELNIVVTVVEIRGDRVNLGFEGPRNIQIARQEVYKKPPTEGNK
jgi:carbon storage regulator